MGCSASKNSTRKDLDVVTVGSTARTYLEEDRKGQTEVSEVEEKRPLPHLDERGKLTPQEIAFRTKCSRSNQTILVGSEQYPIEIQYALWSQTGYYPDDPFKANQDDLSVTSPFAGEDKDAMFNVFDGHGKTGHDCAAYAKQHLPRLAEKYIKQARVRKYQDELRKQGKLKGSKLFDPANWPALTPEEYKSCCQKAFHECNKNMQESTMVEANVSGTTALSVCFHGNMMTVCNVGDSRVILGHKVNTAENGADDRDSQQILAIPLSRDQTPFRKDERERVKRLGAAVMSIDQIEGKEDVHENFGDLVLGGEVDFYGDPPRVWVEGKSYPGCAFTRSLGDTLAEGIGVISEPEMISRELTENDQVLVLATDGIFEFMTNQEVIEMSLACGSPQKACQCLVDAAYNLWLKYERRVDDITIIVCHIKCSKPVPFEGVENTTKDLVNLAESAYGTKPIRRPRGKNDTLCNIPIALPNGLTQ